MFSVFFFQFVFLCSTLVKVFGTLFSLAFTLPIMYFVCKSLVRNCSRRPERVKWNWWWRSTSYCFLLMANVTAVIFRKLLRIHALLLEENLVLMFKAPILLESSRRSQSMEEFLSLSWAVPRQPNPCYVKCYNEH